MSGVTLVLGGARSGKSRHALALAQAAPAPHRFIATAQAHDAEMAERIARHRAERGGAWRTIEAPLDLPDAIVAAQAGVTLVDCCTIWLSNVMLAGQGEEAAVEALAHAVARAAGPLVLVSNEVGCGIVPETPLGRRFRDAHGRMNQRLAASADRVELVVAGLPLRLKG